MNMQDIRTPDTGNGSKSRIAVLKKYYERFVRIRGNPREIGLGLALGLFIGMSPTMGFQMGIAVFFAALFKWNKISAAAGVWISNPFTAPFIYGTTYYVGAICLHPEQTYSLPTNLEALVELLKQAPEIFWIMTVGGVVTGIPIAILGYYFALSAVKKYQDEIKEKLAREKEKLRKLKQMKKRKKQDKKGADKTAV